MFIVNTTLFQYFGLGMASSFLLPKFVCLGNKRNKCERVAQPHINPNEVSFFCVFGLRTNQKKTFKTHLEGPETVVYYGHKNDLRFFVSR